MTEVTDFTPIRLFLLYYYKLFVITINIKYWSNPTMRLAATCLWRQIIPTSNGIFWSILIIFSSRCERPTWLGWARGFLENGRLRKPNCVFDRLLKNVDVDDASLFPSCRHNFFFSARSWFSRRRCWSGRSSSACSSETRPSRRATSSGKPHILWLIGCESWLLWGLKANVIP